MRNFKQLARKDEHGLTLVEVLASIVIISIIFISIITILTQTARTNKTSVEIIDATYLAQTEMENLYAISRQGTNPVLDGSIYSSEPDDGSWKVYHKQSADPDFFFEIRKEDLADSMSRIVVRVYDKTDVAKSEPRAQMETLLKWGAD